MGLNTSVHLNIQKVLIFIFVKIREGQMNCAKLRK